MSKMSGRVLGSFEVVDEMAEGGMGTLLLARQISLGRPAVLKKVRSDLTAKRELLDRFEREARAAASIHHHNVVAVYDYFSHRNHEYIAQEFVDGADLATVLRKKGSLPWRVAAIVTLEVLRGLEEIHSQGTVHRDLKPSNILLGRRGEVKITDFGIALEASGTGLTTPGTFVGTPPYAPPEQLMGERMDARGDLYSLGVCLYEMLTGDPPFPVSDEDDGETLLERMKKEKYTPVRQVVRRVPRFLAGVVRRSLRAKVRRRVSTARELRRLLERRLGNPSPADVRAALAGWLWDAQVFEPRRNETIVQVHPSLPRASLSAWRWVAVGLVGALGTAALLLHFFPDNPFLPSARIREIPAALTDPVRGVPSIDPAELWSSFGARLEGEEAVPETTAVPPRASDPDSDLTNSAPGPK